MFLWTWRKYHCVDYDDDWKVEELLTAVLGPGLLFVWKGFFVLSTV